jgi:hypothetical protein
MMAKASVTSAARRSNPRLVDQTDEPQGPCLVALVLLTSSKDCWRTMVMLERLVETSLHAHGHPNIAAALRYYARDATRVLPLLGIKPVNPTSPHFAEILA